MTVSLTARRGGPENGPEQVEEEQIKEGNLEGAPSTPAGVAVDSSSPCSVLRSAAYREQLAKQAQALSALHEVLAEREAENEQRRAEVELAQLEARELRQAMAEVVAAAAATEPRAEDAETKPAEGNGEEALVLDESFSDIAARRIDGEFADWGEQDAEGLSSFSLPSIDLSMPFQCLPSTFQCLFNAFHSSPFGAGRCGRSTGAGRATCRPPTKRTSCGGRRRCGELDGREPRADGCGAQQQQPGCTDGVAAGLAFGRGRLGQQRERVRELRREQRRPRRRGVRHCFFLALLPSD